MKRKVLIIVLLVIGTISTFLLYKSSTNKEVVLDDVILKEEENNEKMFAILLETSLNSGTYTESNSNEFPTEGYTFNTTKSGCINNKGEKIDDALEFNNGILNISVGESVQCYVYFDVLE